jgi:uncharacterized membrane protein
MVWILVALCSLIYFFGCWLTYCESWKEKWWYIPLGVMLGMVANAVWFLAVKMVADRDKVFVMGLIWDLAVVFIYTLTPILLFGVSWNRWTVLGLILMVAGVMIVKCCSPSQ